MEHQTQTEQVKRALELEERISSLKESLSRIQRAAPPTKPAPPTRTVIEQNIPPIIPKTVFRFRWMLLPPLVLFLLFFMSLFTASGAVLSELFFFAAILWIPGYYIVTNHRIKQETEQIKASEEYQRQCDAAQQTWQQAQDKADQEFQQAQSNYQTVILPQFEAGKAAWLQKQAQETEETTNQLHSAQAELSQLYQESKIVPGKYRTIPALSYIYEILSTSDYDVSYAISSYDRQLQRELEEARLREQQQANALAQAQLQAQQEANDLADQQNQIADRARREARTAAAVAAVQRHNTNRYLKK